MPLVLWADGYFGDRPKAATQLGVVAAMQLHQNGHWKTGLQINSISERAAAASFDNPLRVRSRRNSDERIGGSS